MKKVIALIVMLMFVGLNAQAASLATAVAKYKKQNYLGCISDLNDTFTKYSKDQKDTEITNKIMSTVSKYDLAKIESNDQTEIEKLNEELKKISLYKKSDSNKMAYMFYYYALSLHQIGSGKAKGYYETAAKMSPHSKINEYSKKAIACLDSPDSCKSSDMDEFIRSGKQVSDDIIKEELKKDLERHKNNINAGKDLSLAPQDEEKLSWVDEGITPEIIETAKEDIVSNVPTDEEIGRAVRTLQKAGINPMSYMNMPVNNEYAQLNALLNEGNNYSNDYYSTMMMNNNNGKVSPELMQTIMRQQMMGGFGSF